LVNITQTYQTFFTTLSTLHQYTAGIQVNWQLSRFESKHVNNSDEQLCTWSENFKDL